MTALLEAAYTEVSKLSPDQQEDFARWMLAELANMQQWNKSALQAADSMEWMADEIRAESHNAETT